VKQKKQERKKEKNQGKERVRLDGDEDDHQNSGEDEGGRVDHGGSCAVLAVVSKLARGADATEDGVASSSGAASTGLGNVGEANRALADQTSGAASTVVVRGASHDAVGAVWQERSQRAQENQNSNTSSASRFGVNCIIAWR